MATARLLPEDATAIDFTMVIVANIKMNASRMMIVVGEGDASILMPLPLRENSVSANWDILAQDVLKVKCCCSYLLKLF